ncbi:RsmB/NOP family class I SAM-dependent RNA methyltransferase [Quatrionicoccus australiensis]|uniref:RsmB/NOP family class I SAM-dependent RNA methyltransferase n=1 Tax=Quatrionicoccus australiensis TaxID=138118 RepID=UPI001CFB32BE|nr:RsmB/NOP family class I SAM-dependent RNA methyltransferase [Quatrionicoccus australiensis]MCB4361163.1 RsmB/NOP family class I SAM-dependent RNA methyltransferase [Quatrionicoccus australiensis]
MKARFTPALFAHAEAVIGQLLRFEHPADAVVSRYFRDHRELGHADRAFVAETVFAVLRRGRSLEARCAGQLSDRHLLLVALAVTRGWNQRELAPVLRANEEEWLAAARAMPDSEFSPAVRCDLPDWLYNKLEAQFGAEETEKLAHALNQPAPLDLRVNTLKTNRDAVLARFAEEGIGAAAGPLSPTAIRLREKPALAKHALFLEGAFEVQDEGSQLLGYLLEPRRGEMVVDFCAGAGGKTLLLGALMKNTGRLYAFDVSDKRLVKLKPRLARSGLSNVHPARIEHERDQKIKRLSGKADRVLVDAPCSGLGTLRRNPDLKWRQSEESVAELTVKQAAILDSAARLVRPGGRLVYATCSLLTAENDAIVADFLAKHPEFTLTPASTVLAKHGIEFSGDLLRLLPNQHNTDGFFAAVLDRKA